MGLVLPRAGLPAGLRELCTRSTARCSIFDEVMTGFRVGARRRARARRHRARPDDARQDHRRRLSGRRVRRTRRRDGATSRPTVPSIRPARCRAIRLRWPRASRRWTIVATTRRSTNDWKHDAPAHRGPDEVMRRHGVPHTCSRAGSMFCDSSLRPSPSSISRARDSRIARSSRSTLPPCSIAASISRRRRSKPNFMSSRAHRARHRTDGRRGRRLAREILRQRDDRPKLDRRQAARPSRRRGLDPPALRLPSRAARKRRAAGKRRSRRTGWRHCSATRSPARRSARISARSVRWGAAGKGMRSIR